MGDGGVFLAEDGVGFGDADEGDLGMGGEGVEEAPDVVVVEAGRWLRGRVVVVWAGALAAVARSAARRLMEVRNFDGNDRFISRTPSVLGPISDLYKHKRVSGDDQQLTQC